MAVKKNSMSDAHKAALAAGRAQGRAVRDYLEALEASKPRPGRKATPESVSKRIAAISEQIEDASPVQRVSLIQQRMDLEAQMASFDAVVDIDALEKAFVDIAAAYSASKGISYAAWREAGGAVPFRAALRTPVHRSAWASRIYPDLRDRRGR